MKLELERLARNAKKEEEGNGESMLYLVQKKIARLQIYKNLQQTVIKFTLLLIFHSGLRCRKKEETNLKTLSNGD